jgi:hypothetical protein
MAETAFLFDALILKHQTATTIRRTSADTTMHGIGTRHGLASLSAQHYQGVATMTLKHRFAGIALASLLAIAYSSVSLFAQTEAKWFVLRNHEVGNCWTATLIRLDGQYTSTFERKAGGPYPTEAQALERQKILESNGSCNRTE